MGGDFGPAVTVRAAIKVLNESPNLHLILVGNEQLIKNQLRRCRQKPILQRISIVHTTQTVSSDEPAGQALRTKKDSAMRVAINLVHEGRAAACVSAGNTGALMATARFVLKTLPGIDRPAILAPFPTIIRNKEVWLLDLGANVDCSSDNLYQFAVMASILLTAIKGKERPKIALLNIGEEVIKGNDLVKQSAELIAQNKLLNYVGFVEANNIFKGEVDAVVCDGFVGNVLLKASEGVARLIKHYLAVGIKKNWLTRIAALPLTFVLRPLITTIDPRNKNGAIFLGLNGIVVKSHGGAKVRAFANAIHVAQLEAEKNVTEQISEQLNTILDGDTA